MNTSLSSREVSAVEMEQVFAEVQTPFKYGIVLHPEPDTIIDSPNVFRFGDHWFMIYIASRNLIGYETLLARSDDLVHWEPLGKVLPFVESGWDKWQASGGIALIDPTWGGSCELQAFDGKYWISYLGGELQGYETNPLFIGIAWSEKPDIPRPWNRLESNPVLSPYQNDSRPFEQATLYKSFVLWDKTESLGAPFVMFYNGKQQGTPVERIGMALSHDMKHWQRCGDGPVIDNGTGISGDPQIVRMGDLWMMFYFGAGWKPGAFDTFACSYDLQSWTKWEGPALVEPTESWDARYAHKPWVLKHEGVVYHYYCAVDNDGNRAIALATSKDLRA